jgi:hypothetical protein
MKTLLGNASRNDKDFWIYDPATSNCQGFTKEVIERNNLTPANREAKEICKIVLFY